MLVPTLTLAGLGLVSGLGLAVAARIFAVETDPRQEQIADLLPGANCGGCGYAGCNDFAAAVVAGDVGANACPVCDAESRAAVAAVMGAVVEDVEPSVAIVLCQGDDAHASRRFRYNGAASCASAALLGGGDKTCTYGCLGLGDCAAACAFGAVEMTESGIARIIPERCTGCGQCITACPKDIIRLVPKSATVHVLCSSHDKGGAAKKACSVACIGCKKCEKFFDEDPRVKVADFLAVIDYEGGPIDPAVIQTCPTGAMVDLAHDGGEERE